MGISDVVKVAIISGIVTLLGKILDRIFTRKDKKTSTDSEQDARLTRIEHFAEEIKDTVKGINLSGLRNELMILMHCYEDDEHSIMQVGEVYFKAGGDFYMDAKFQEYLDKRGLPKPSWFDK